MEILKTKGLIAAPPTGFTKEGGIDVEVVAPLATHLMNRGVSGMFINGTTGEGVSLTIRERETLAVAWREAIPAGDVRLFVHVGDNCLEDARRLARHAMETGADAIASIAPGFFKPSGAEEVVEWCAHVASAAPELPFYFYHMPSKSGVDLRIAPFIRQAAERIPNFAGVKFTFEALDDYLECLRLDEGRYDVLWGRDEMLLSALAVGACGGVGSTYNLATPLYLRIRDAFEANDFPLARDLQARAVGLISTMTQFGDFFSVLKAVLRAQGVPISPLVRPPLTSLSPEKAEEAGRRCLEILEDESSESVFPFRDTELTT